MRKRNYSYLPIVFAVIILALYIPFQSQAKRVGSGIFAGTLSAFSAGGTKIGGWFSFVGHISKLRSENEFLSNKLTEMEIDKNEIAELRNENALLQKELGFIEANKEETLLPSRIISREPTTFLDSVLIDKGEADGVAKGMPAISGGVLIGQVSEVYPNQARVLLITSKDSNILAMLQDSRAKGILRGGIAGLVLENIMQDVTYEPGENVVTSGLGGDMPPGILIGKTGKIESATSDLFKNISVEPIADLSKLELIFIKK